ncbi:MAG: DUF3810 domain-containing protein [Ruminococcaceae bacterium]|nr:DUF3810 domain-containing protein [Oscillospiraceae bacterium]
MNATKERRSSRFISWFKLCPIRHILIIIFALIIAAYFLLRGNEALLIALSNSFVRPWHRALSSFSSLFPFSLCAVLIAFAVVSAMIYIIFQLVHMLRRREALKRLYRMLTTILMAFCVFYGGFCGLWGIYFYTADFEEQSGIHARPISTYELKLVTRYFTYRLNEYSDDVRRDENGLFAEDMDAIFDYSPQLYDAVSEEFPCLDGKPLRSKPFIFSKVLSHMTFTGFFFPFTGEANINTDSPSCMTASTIAHEIAHQRGVAQEDEANFVAVLASFADGNPVYCYSSCLMAYTYLSNALYSADYDAWLDNYLTLSPEALADLKYNSSYWEKYRDSVVNTASDAIYTGMLHSYGQTDGLKTYGKCVDLLVTYYLEDAVQHFRKVS